MGGGLNALETVGAANTVRVALLLPDPAAGVCVVVTTEVVLFLPPAFVLVTLKITVQLLLAGIVIPDKLSAVAPFPTLRASDLVQVPVTDPPAALMLTRVSVNAPPD